MTTSTTIEYQDRHIRSKESRLPRVARTGFRAHLADNAILLDAQGALICRQQRTERRTSTLTTTSKPDAGVVAAEIALSATGLSIAGYTTAHWVLGTRGGNRIYRDEWMTPTNITLFLIIPATVGVISGLAAWYDIESKETQTKVQQTFHALPDEYGPCNDATLKGVAITIRSDHHEFHAHLDANARATFPIQEEDLDSFVNRVFEILIEDHPVARVQVESQ